MVRTPTADLGPAILAAAGVVLEDVGAGAFTLRAVAQRAEVSLQSIYNRFASKNDLLDEVAHQGFEALTASLLEQDGIELSEFTDPIGNIHEGLRRYREYTVQNPNVYGLMFDAPLPDFRISDRTLGTAFGTLTVLIDAVATAQDAGDLAPGEPLDYAQRIWAAAHGVVRFELTQTGFIDDWADHYGNTVSTMIEGLRSNR
jgi:AcrR family transcriptional regulator